jgi:hypothetical protein
VKFETTTAVNSMLVGKRVGAGNQRSYLFFGNEGVGLYLDTSPNGSTISQSSVAWTYATGTWYHIAVTKNGTSVKFYVNGAQQGTTQTHASSGIFNSTAPFEVGGFNSDNKCTDGKIDDVRVWSRELSGSEIASLYTYPDSFSNGASLQGSWKLDSGYTDSSGNGNTLTGQGSPVFSNDVPYIGPLSTSSDNYSHAETGYSNPHAPSAFFNGVATTTFSYDANGNLATTTGAATSTFNWDYRNRLTRAAVPSGTSTYQYDHKIARMAQITPTTTNHYPNKFYSVEYAGSSTTTGTSTSYIWHGDTLVAYIEQRIANGQVAGGNYVHLVRSN